MRIRISSDSTCDLTRQWLLEHEVEVLPLYTIKEGETFLDGVDITPVDIFAHVSAGGSLCSTAALNVDDYLNAFSRLTAEGDAVIHINISSEFSSCYQNACIAAQDFDNVYVVDSRNLSTGHGHVVCEAVKLVKAGELSPQEIVDHLNEFTSRVDASFVLDQLEYLRKGGRCSTLAALGANLLSLKPCIEVKDGKMNVGKKYRGKYKNVVVSYIKDRLTNRDDIEPERIFLTYTEGTDESVVEAARAAIEECGSFQEIMQTTAGCTVSCHCGPSTLGILYVTKKA